VGVANPFEKEEREDVTFEVSRVHRAAQNIGGFPEVGFQLIQTDGGCVHLPAL
jgi:hypothetical protein